MEPNSEHEMHDDSDSAKTHVSETPSPPQPTLPPALFSYRPEPELQPHPSSSLPSFPSSSAPSGPAGPQPTAPPPPRKVYILMSGEWDPPLRTLWDHRRWTGRPLKVFTDATLAMRNLATQGAHEMKDIRRQDPKGYKRERHLRHEHKGTLKEELYVFEGEGEGEGDDVDRIRGYWIQETEVDGRIGGNGTSVGVVQKPQEQEQSIGLEGEDQGGTSSSHENPSSAPQLGPHLSSPELGKPL